MKHLKVVDPSVALSLSDFSLHGDPVINETRKIKDLSGIFLDEKAFVEMNPGSLHNIGGDIAHRLANTGSENLIVGACWPSDAGHDYQEILRNGFSARLVEIDGKPSLVECK